MRHKSGRSPQEIELLELLPNWSWIEPGSVPTNIRLDSQPQPTPVQTVIDAKLEKYIRDEMVTLSKLGYTPNDLVNTIKHIYHI